MTNKCQEPFPTPHPYLGNKKKEALLASENGTAWWDWNIHKLVDIANLYTN